MPLIPVSCINNISDIFCPRKIRKKQSLSKAFVFVLELVDNDGTKTSMKEHTYQKDLLSNDCGISLKFYYHLPKDQNAAGYFCIQKKLITCTVSRGIQNHSRGAVCQ